MHTTDCLNITIIPLLFQHYIAYKQAVSNSPYNYQSLYIFKTERHLAPFHHRVHLKNNTSLAVSTGLPANDCNDGLELSFNAIKQSFTTTFTVHISKFNNPLQSVKKFFFFYNLWLLNATRVTWLKLYALCYS